MDLREQGPVLVAATAQPDRVAGPQLRELEIALRLRLAREVERHVWVAGMRERGLEEQVTALGPFGREGLREQRVGALTIAGVVLAVLFGREKEDDARALRLVPQVGPSSIGLVVGGAL